MRTFYSDDTHQQVIISGKRVIPTEQISTYMTVGMHVNTVTHLHTHIFTYTHIATSISIQNIDNGNRLLLNDLLALNVCVRVCISCGCISMYWIACFLFSVSKHCCYCWWCCSFHCDVKPLHRHTHIFYTCSYICFT